MSRAQTCATARLMRIDGRQLEGWMGGETSDDENSDTAKR